MGISFRSKLWYMIHRCPVVVHVLSYSMHRIPGLIPFSVPYFPLHTAAHWCRTHTAAWPLIITSVSDAETRLELGSQRWRRMIYLSVKILRISYRITEHSNAGEKCWKDPKNPHPSLKGAQKSQPATSEIMSQLYKKSSPIVRKNRNPGNTNPDGCCCGAVEGFTMLPL